MFLKDNDLDREISLSAAAATTAAPAGSYQYIPVDHFSFGINNFHFLWIGVLIRTLIHKVYRLYRQRKEEYLSPQKLFAEIYK
jgi:hypothetical protein